jgi:3-deoxy-D-manno-octulosonate 8-phosphate phosphatase (KDO 8-P phosphatase)
MSSSIDPALARSIRLVALDVDGVMTDGGIYLGAVDGRPLEFKRYDIQDGVGLHMLRYVGIHIAMVTGRVSDSVRLRAAELQADVFQDPDGRKLEGFLSICQRNGVRPDETAFLGDDFPDYPILRIVGLPVAVGNAVPEIRALCAHRLAARGGRGAIREFVEDFLKARGEWDTAWNRYVDARSQPKREGRA